MTLIYVLKLEENKYYVGKTNNLQSRLYYHKSGDGSAWTKRYHMISLYKTYDPPMEIDSDFYEDMIVKMYMKIFGIQNVRGGSYSQIYLDDAKIKLITNEIYGATNKCFRCGGDHFIKKCTQLPDHILDLDIEKGIINKPEIQQMDTFTRILASAERKVKRWYAWYSQ